MGALDFQTNGKADGEGVLAVFWRILQSKASGILILDSDKAKKQIAFRRGEPILVRSNLPEETFAAFLVAQKLIDRTTLKTQLAKKEAVKDVSSLTDWLLKEGLLRSEMLPLLLESHFRERIFNLFSDGARVFNFKSVSDDHIFEGDIRALSEPFPKLLLQAALSQLTDKIARSRFSTHLMKIPKISAPFLLPLNSQQSRLWNQIENGRKQVKDLDAESLKLLAVAQELGMIDWQDTVPTIEKPVITIKIKELTKEMKDLEKRFEKANAHEILGVALMASAEECQKVYYDLIRKYHPDRLPAGATDEQKQTSERLFSKINLAFHTLTDPEKRTEYLAQVELEKAGGVEAIHKKVEAEFMIPQAQQALKRKHFKGALEMYQKIEKAISDDGEIIADRVYCEFMLLTESKSSLAALGARFRKELDHAIQLRPRYAWAFYYRGLLTKALGQANQALLDFKTALQIDSKLAEASSEVRLMSMRTQKKK
ncbi:MAG: tetratricopeptide repeat protein [Bacteriovoracaceae bacterium]|nr:tetratricopeptide repeat protein [Bacteriovoracaceae bacterium]